MILWVYESTILYFGRLYHSCTYTHLDWDLPRDIINFKANLALQLFSSVLGQ